MTEGSKEGSTTAGGDGSPPSAMSALVESLWEGLDWLNRLNATREGQNSAENVCKTWHRLHKFKSEKFYWGIRRVDGFLW